MLSSWHLKEMTVSGFRGFTEAQDFIFAAPLIVLDGPQGSGKSSTLVAIEWCIFGDEIAKKACGIDERKGWKVRNTEANEAYVEVMLAKGSNTLKIVRSDRKSRGTPPFYFELNGSRNTDEYELRTMLGIEPKDYFSSVHLHQEVIKALLVEDPRIRKDMMDRLLGLSDLRNIIDGIKSAKIISNLKDIDGEFNEIGNRLSAVMASKQKDIENEKEQGIEEGLNDKDFSELVARRMCSAVKKAIADFAKQTKLSAVELPTTNTLEEQSSFMHLTKDILRRLRDERPDLRQRKELLKKQLKIQELITEYKETIKELSGYEAGIKEIHKKDGKPSQIRKRIKNELEPKLEDARIRRNRINKRAGIIDEAIEYFDAIAISAKKEPCPVCEKPIDDVKQLKKHLDEIRESLNESLEPIREEIGGYESEISRLQKAVEDLDGLDEDIQDAHEELTSYRRDIQGMIPQEIKDTDDLVVILNSEISAIENNLKQIEDNVTKSSQQLNDIEDDIIRLGHILTSLRIEFEIGELLKIKETQEYRNVEDCKKKVEEFAAAVAVVQQSIEKVLEKNARRKLETTKESVSQMFKNLANHPDYSDLEIDPDSYEILAVKSGDKAPALSVLNEGDLNCAGLSLFLSLGMSQDLCHDLGFIVLDDPSQTLDLSHKENLMDIINGIPEDKQLIISTSQSDLKDLILGKTVKKKQHYKFAERSMGQGVKLL